MRNLVETRVSNVDKHVRKDEQAVRLCNYVDVCKRESIGQGIDFMVATATKDEIDRFRLAAGDVLITKDSEDWNDIGVPALVDEAPPDVLFGYHLALLRPRAIQIRVPFLFRALQAITVASQFRVRANGVTRYGFSQDATKSARLTVPPLTEQAAISRYLDRTIANLGLAISRLRDQIVLLDEYRNQLVAEAETGQVDVRNATSAFVQESTV